MEQELIAEEDPGRGNPKHVRPALEGNAGGFLVQLAPAPVPPGHPVDTFSPGRTKPCANPFRACG